VDGNSGGVKESSNLESQTRVQSVNEISLKSSTVCHSSL
jgi:hypothetical protein